MAAIRAAVSMTEVSAKCWPGGNNPTAHIAVISTSFEAQNHLQLVALLADARIGAEFKASLDQGAKVKVIVSPPSRPDPVPRVPTAAN